MPPSNTPQSPALLARSPEELIFGKDVRHGSPRGPREQEAAAQAMFLMEAAVALSSYGTPAHQVERAMEECGRSLGILCQFSSLPTAVTATFGEGWDARTYMRRVPVTGVHLERLVAIDQVIQEVASGEIAPQIGTARIHRTLAGRRRYGSGLMALFNAGASAAFALLFLGGWREFLAAGVVGLVVGALGEVNSRRVGTRRMLDFACGFVASLLAAVVTRVLPPARYDIILVSGLIGLMPGLTITLAVKELATVNILAGTARLMGAATILFSAIFGVALSRELLPPRFSTLPVPEVLPWVGAVAALVATCMLSFSLRAHPRHVPSMIVVGVLGYGAATFGDQMFGADLGLCMGALAVGVVSNLYARVVNRPSAVTMIPGILLMVPGSVSFRSLVSFLELDALRGIDTAFQGVLIAAALVTGLLLANVGVRPRRVL